MSENRVVLAGAVRTPIGKFGGSLSNLPAETLGSAGEAEIVVAGGMENMSSAPYVLEQARFGYRMGNGSIVDTMINDALWDAFNDDHMGMTAENVAEQYQISREMQDQFVAHSQQKCEQAIKEGKFDEEIVPVPIKVKRETVLFSKDEHPRAGSTAESLAAFKREGGTVTAGNASGINDGAAAVVVMSEKKAQELGVTPMAVFVGGAWAGYENET